MSILFLRILARDGHVARAVSPVPASDRCVRCRRQTARGAQEFGIDARGTTVSTDDVVGASAFAAQNALAGLVSLRRASSST